MYVSSIMIASLLADMNPYLKVSPHMLKFLKIGFIGLCLFNPLLLIYITIRKDTGLNLPLDQSDCLPQHPTEEQKIILFWTPFFTKIDFEIGIGDQVFSHAQCPVHNCLTTTDRKLLPKANAVIFHMRDIISKDLPDFRSPCQRWIFFLYESPLNTHMNLNPYSGLFNWTMTYRLDADIGGPHTLVERISGNGPLVNYARGKDKLAAWFVSNCWTFSNREKLVKELEKYIPIDVYGDCGSLKCPREKSSQCFQMVERHYKFYLSLENSICEDYVTEKVFDVLRYNVVPVVYGGGNYTKLLPPHSYINAMDFESVQQLADYLILVNSNDSLYNSYFEWKARYILKSNNHWCSLCAKLNDDSEPFRVYHDIDTWWNGNGNCQMGRHMKIFKFNIWQRIFYWAVDGIRAFLLFRNV